jgi:uncharacterized protein YyaL (SSP411 family)
VAAELPPPDAELACAWWDMTPEGFWVGRNIPKLPQPLEAFAASRGLEAAIVRERLDRAREVLYRARARRVPPGLDDKVLAGWNGLMISAFAEGYRALRDRRYLEAATRAAEFVTGNLAAPGGRLHRSWRRGTTRGAGVLEDYAYLGNGLLDLYEAGGAWHWFEAAERLASRVRTGFAAPGGGFFATSDAHEALVVRFREGGDGATPSANAEAARLLARLGYHRGDAAMLAEAAGALAAWAGALRQAPRAFASSLLVADLLLDGPVELALVGPARDAGTEALWAAPGALHPRASSPTARRARPCPRCSRGRRRWAAPRRCTSAGISVARRRSPTRRGSLSERGRTDRSRSARLPVPTIFRSPWPTQDSFSTTFGTGRPGPRKAAARPGSRSSTRRASSRLASDSTSSSTRAASSNSTGS